MKGTGARSIAINTAYLGAARAVTSVSRALYAVLLARQLGTELYGQYNYGLSWYLLFLPVTLLGLKWVLAREIGRQRTTAPRLAGITLSLQLVAATVAAASSALLAAFLEADATTATLLQLFSLALAGRSLALWANALFTALESAAYVLYLDTAFRILEVVLGLTMLWLGHGILALASLHALSWLLQGALALWLARKQVGELKPIFDWKEARTILKQGLPFAVAAAFTSWLFQGPLILYRHWEGLGDDLGRLALALQAFTLIAMVVGELGNAALPVLSRSVARGDGKANRYLTEVFRLGWLMAALLFIGALGLGKPVVLTLLGEGYQGTIELLPWSLLLVSLHFWIFALQGLVGLHGHFLSVVVANFAGALLFTLAFPLLTPALGSLGPLAAFGIGLTTVVTIQVSVLGRYYPLSAGRMFFQPLVALACGAAVCLLWRDQAPWLATLGGILLALAVAAGLARMFAAEERMG